MIKCCILIAYMGTLTIADVAADVAHPTTWNDAADKCGDGLYTFNPASDASISGNVSAVKHSLHITRNADIWVGNIIKLDISTAPLVHGPNTCAAITFTKMVLVKNIYVFSYDLVSQNCSVEISSLCSVPGHPTTLNLNSLKTNWNATKCTSPYSLWVPSYTSVQFVHDGIVGHGSWNSSINSSSILQQQFWVNYTIGQTRTTAKHAEGTILKCGYLKYNQSDIPYTDCSEHKLIACRDTNGTDNGQHTTSGTTFYHTQTDTRHDTHIDITTETSTTTLTNNNLYSKQSTKTGLNVGVYIGAGASALVVVVCFAAAVAIILRRRKQQTSETSDKESDDNNLPKGGRSFTRRKSDVPNPEHESNRITMYAKIDPKEVREMIGIDIGHNDHSDPNYDSIAIKTHTTNTPDVVPKPAKRTATTIPSKDKAPKPAKRTTIPSKDVVPKPPERMARTMPSKGYLTMDGRGKPPQNDDDGDYDSLQQSGSSSKLTESLNIYGLNAENDTSDDTYNVTFERQSSRKALVDSYDHVTVSPTGTMNRAFCDSITVGSEGTNLGQTYQHNPIYDVPTRSQIF